MKTLLRLLPLACLATSTLAQEPFDTEPAKELSAFESMLGHWEGRGTVVMMPGTPAMSWGATIDVERILDGHAVAEALVVDMGEMGKMEMRTIYAFDSAAGELITFGLSSMGGNAGGTAEWVERGTLVGITSGYDQGGWFIDRATSKFTGDEWTFDIQRMTKAGPAFEHVTGAFKRTAAAGTPRAASARAEALAEPLARLKPFLGEWRLDGWMIPIPGMERMPVGGVERMRPVFGGQALEIRVKGDEDPSSGVRYEALGYIFWDEHNGCYQSAHVSNMSEAGHAPARWTEDGAFVTTYTGTFMDMPMVQRSVVKFTDAGMHVAMDRMLGDGKAERTFEAKYTRVAKDD